MAFPKPIPLLLLLSVLASLFSNGCTNKQKDKILIINSYHQGYPSSDDIMAGITERLEDSGIELKICYLDTKRLVGESLVDTRVKEVLKTLGNFEPDLVIASDDNAVALVVVPYLNRTEIPVVFCGVNWSARKYDLGENVCGILEVLPLKECILTIKNSKPGIRKISVLSEDSQSERNNTTLLDTLYKNLGMQAEYYLVDDFGQWKEAFKTVSSCSDLVYMPTNGAIRNWDKKEARAFVKENLKVPVITCDDFMMDYCVFGRTKIAKEQGEWAAKTALRILSGVSPEKIPLAQNGQWQTYFNTELANVIGFKLNYETE